MKYKQLILAYSTIILIAIISIFPERQNSVTIEGDIKRASIDSTLFKKLAILVDENKFSRQYYEVIYMNQDKGCSPYIL